MYVSACVYVYICVCVCSLLTENQMASKLVKLGYFGGIVILILSSIIFFTPQLTKDHRDFPLAQAFQRELTKAATAEQLGDTDTAYKHLGRAHIIGQRKIDLHIRAHASMLRMAISIGDVREVFGQLMRLLLVVPGHIINRLPIGNTGLANVSAFKPMTAPADLQELLDRS